MNRRTTGIVTTGLLCVTAMAPLLTAAQSRPAAQHVLSRGIAESATTRALAGPRGNEHVLYGRIDAIRGAVLSVRTRSGRAQRVEAADALRSGNYSEPLFIGKIVVIRGSYDTSGTLRAQSVIRMGQLDPSTAPDR